MDIIPGLLVLAAIVAVIVANDKHKTKKAAEARQRLETAEQEYRDVLSRLKSHSEAKPRALELGRIVYGMKRPDGKLTIYDEQAIQNDIQAHS